DEADVDTRGELIAEQPAARRMVGHRHALLRVAAWARGFLRREHADDLEADAVDRDALADRARHRAAQPLGHLLADHRHPRGGLLFSVGIVAPGADLVVGDREVAGRYAADVIAVALLPGAAGCAAAVLDRHRLDRGCRARLEDRLGILVGQLRVELH